MVRQIKFKNFLNFIFAMTARTSRNYVFQYKYEVSMLNRSIGLNARKRISVHFHKIFKGPLFCCQKFLELKSLWKWGKLWVLLIFVMKTDSFLIKSLAKVVRKSSKSNIEKLKYWRFSGSLKSKSKFLKIWLFFFYVYYFFILK